MDLEKLGDFFKQAMGQRQQLIATMDKVKVEAEAGGGVVRVTMNGRKQVLKLSIDPSALSAAGSDITMLEDLIIAAVNEAGRKAAEAVEAASSGMLENLSDLGLPGL